MKVSMSCLWVSIHVSVTIQSAKVSVSNTINAHHLKCCCSVAEPDLWPLYSGHKRWVSMKCHTDYESNSAEIVPCHRNVDFFLKVSPLFIFLGSLTQHIMTILAYAVYICPNTQYKRWKHAFLIQQLKFTVKAYAWYIFLWMFQRDVWSYIRLAGSSPTAPARPLSSQGSSTWKNTHTHTQEMFYTEGYLLIFTFIS